MPIPVYTFTGFLDSGKTKFIQETLEDERFNSGERTLLLICEEGEEEYDPSTYPHKAVYPEVIDQETVTTEELDALQKKHHAQRVILELNGMQMIVPFYQKMPRDWELAQEVPTRPRSWATTPTCAPSSWTSSPVRRWSSTTAWRRPPTRCPCTSWRGR